MLDKNQENKRLFFGLDFEKEDKYRIFKWLENSVDNKRKSVLEHNLHLTLAFLPNVTLDNEQKLIEFAKHLTLSPFQLQFEHTGYWQDTGIFYLKPNKVTTQLTELATSLRAEGERLGIYKNPHAFHPHITLKRNCKPQPRINKNITPFNVEFKQFKLFHSTRVNNQLRYLPMMEFPLY